MNEIDRLWEKYSSPMDIGYEKMVRLTDIHHFRQAITEALEKQRGLSAKTALNHLLAIDLRVSGLSNKILNTKLEEQK